MNYCRSALFKCCVVWLVQQDSTAYEKEKDIISVVSRPPPSPLSLSSRPHLCECLLLQCRQVTAACDDILTSSPEALLTHTAQLESVDLVPASPGDKLVKPTFLAFDHFRNIHSHTSFHLDYLRIKVIIFSLEKHSKSYIFPTLIIQTMFFIHFNGCLLFFQLSLNFHFCHLTCFPLFSSSSIFYSTVCTRLSWKFPLPLCSTHLLFNLIQGPSCTHLFSCYSLPELFFFSINAFPSLLFTRCIQSTDYVSPLRVLYHFLPVYLISLE